MRSIPDFPEPGIVFRDATTVIRDPDGFQLAIDGLEGFSTTWTLMSVGAKARGVVFGRPKTEPPDGFDKIVKEWKAEKIMTKEAVEQSGLSRSTFYRRAHE